MPDRRKTSGDLSPVEARRIAQIRNGNGKAFEAVFRAYESLVRTICLGLVGTPDVADDLTQDIFCDLWDRRQSFHLKVSLKAYLARAARNKALNWLARSRAQESLDEGGEAQEIEQMKVKATPQDALLYLELEQALEQAIQELPERRRLVYTMARREHMSYAEISSALDISLSTVKTQMARALKFLRQRLKIYKFASQTN